MLTEAMQYIAGLCEQKAEQDFSSLGNATLRTQGGNYELFVTPPDSPRRTILSLEDMRAYVLSRAGNQVDGSNVTDGTSEDVYAVGTEGSVIFYNTDTIRYAEQPHDERGIIATMSLTKSDAFKTLVASEWKSQKDFLRMLRINLRGTMSDDMLIKAMAKVVFKQQSEGASAVVQGRQSMSREILQTINDGTTFPEECNFTVQVFDEVDILVRIECAIEVDFDKNIFRITPYADSLNEAKKETMKHIVERLSEACPRCFYGALNGH